MPDKVIRFLQTLGSVWALRLVILLSDTPERSWPTSELVKELRASDYIVTKLLPRLHSLGLAVETSDRCWKYQPATAELAELTREVAKLHAEKPFAVTQIIAKTPGNRSLRSAKSFQNQRK
jgi:hypothetical protein